MKKQLVDFATDRACYYHADGIPLEDAIRMGVEDARREVIANGLGQPPEILSKVAEAAPVKSIREAISPWLWALSVIGFGLAILNASRIAKMYGSWRAGRQALKRGEAPPETE